MVMFQLFLIFHCAAELSSKERLITVLLEHGYDDFLLFGECPFIGGVRFT